MEGVKGRNMPKREKPNTTVPKPERKQRLEETRTRRIDLTSLYERYLSSIDISATTLKRSADDLVFYLLNGEWPPAGLNTVYGRRLVRGGPTETLLRANFFETAAKDLQTALERKSPGVAEEVLLRVATVGQKTLENLKGGRTLGAKKNKERAEKNEKEWRQISIDLWSKKPFWGVTEHVNHILRSSSGKKRNGMPYAADTIKRVISGTKAEAKEKAG